MNTLQRVMAASLLAFLVPFSSRAEPAQGRSPYAPLEPLIGVWWNSLPPESDGIPRHQETSFAWCGNREAIQSDIWVVKGGKRVSHTSQRFVWNPLERDFALLGTYRDGDLKESVLTSDGEVFASDITVARKDGTTLKVKIRAKLFGADAMSAKIYELRDGKWVMDRVVRLERHAT
jgi:hypothetical protein